MAKNKRKNKGHRKIRHDFNLSNPQELTRKLKEIDELIEYKHSEMAQRQRYLNGRSDSKGRHGDAPAPCGETLPRIIMDQQRGDESILDFAKRKSTLDRQLNEKIKNQNFGVQGKRHFPIWPKWKLQKIKFEITKKAQNNISKEIQALEKNQTQLHSQLKEITLKKKIEILDDLKNQLNEDWLGIEQVWHKRYADYLKKDDLKRERIAFVQKWIKEHSSIDQEVDSEQAAAIGANSKNILVTARAGSGKTGTLVNRVAFLIQHCGVKPEEILVLAFNKKAVKEIETRIAQIQDQSSDEHFPPFARTFHALARQIVEPQETVLFDDQKQGGDKPLSKFIDKHLIKPIAADPTSSNYGLVKKIMLSVFREHIEQFMFSEKKSTDTKEQYLHARRSAPSMGLDGNWYKSQGEKAIANYLFEHDFYYRYERAFDWNKDGKETVYRPDFVIWGTNKKNQAPLQRKSRENQRSQNYQKFNDGKSIILEYFGLSGDPVYNQMSEDKRQHWKQPAREKIFHFEEISQPLAGEELKHFIPSALSRILHKHQIEHTKLSEDEIWEKISEDTISKFGEQITSFLSHVRQNMLMPTELSKLIHEHENQHESIPEGERLFLEFMPYCYHEYLEKLAQHNSIDWPGVLDRAQKKITEFREKADTRFVTKNASGDLLKIKHILIDEFQDFSESYFGIINAIRKQNHDVNIFAVGDDWQAINGFAGANLKFFLEPEKFFGEIERLYITTNYRSDKSIVQSGNAIMTGMSRKGIDAHPVKTKSNGSVELADYTRDNIELTEVEREANGEYGELIPPLMRLISKCLDASEDQEVVVLSHTHTPRGIKKLNDSDPAFRNWESVIRELLPSEYTDRIEFSTAHGYKGLQKRSVIIMDADRYPLIHPFWIFDCIFGRNLKEIEDEERRLFYVAATRATSNLIIMDTQDGRSPFVDSLMSGMQLTRTKWDEINPYPHYPNKDNAIRVYVCNNDGSNSAPTREIKNELKNAEYKFHERQPPNESYWHKKINKDGYLEIIRSENWYKEALRVRVKIEDGNGELLEIHDAYEKGKWRERPISILDDKQKIIELPF